MLSAGTEMNPIL